MKLKKIYEKKVEEDSDWLIIEADGKSRKPRPDEKVPVINIELKEGGASEENGIPVRPTLDDRLRRRRRR